MGERSACPYPACGQPLVVQAGMRACGCELRNGVDRCGQCGVLNRAGAVFCRGCRGPLPEAAAIAARPEVVEADETGMEGAFRRPPLVALGFLYGLTTDGRLMRLAMRTGARSQEIARVKIASAGLNRSALVDATGSGGWTFLAVSEMAVEAVSLATGETRTLYQAEAARPIAVNATEAEAGGSRGVVATADRYGFALRTGVAESTLMVRYFSGDRPAEQPLSLAGRQVMGPALCGSRMLLCTEEEIGFHDTATGETGQVRLPGRFVPMLARSSTKLNVPPGGMPLCGNGREFWVGGFENGRPGLLKVNFEDTGCVFRPLPVGTSLTAGAGGSLAVSMDGDLQGIGFHVAQAEVPRLQAGMPVCYVDPYLLCFAEAATAGKHEVHVLEVESGRMLARLAFEDELCSPATCCGMMVAGQDVVVMSLDLMGTRRGQGLRVAHWDLSR